MEQLNKNCIWIDADACPKMIKDILFKASHRTQTELILVANHYLGRPQSRFIQFIQVTQGFDQADHYIIQKVRQRDLVITADIPLAAEILSKGAYALNPRGEIYTDNTIRQRLQIRDIHEQLRATGQSSGGPATLSEKDKRVFANALDRWLAHKKL